MRGYIYILRTDDRLGTVKIGKTTTHPDKRCSEHNKDWYLSINSWEVSFWRWVENCHKAERELLSQLKRHNLGAKRHREAFKVDPETARDIAVRVCDKYPPKSDKKTDPVMKKKKTLDQIAYNHIQSKGRFSEQIIENQKSMQEEDYYKWLMAVSPYIRA
jgi:hypothetical protein